MFEFSDYFCICMLGKFRYFYLDKKMALGWLFDMANRSVTAVGMVFDQIPFAVDHGNHGVFALFG